MLTIMGVDVYVSLWCLFTDSILVWSAGGVETEVEYGGLVKERWKNPFHFLHISAHFLVVLNVASRFLEVRWPKHRLLYPVFH